MSQIDLFGPGKTAHICVDMQGMFAEDTAWHAPWAGKILPAVEAMVELFPQRTVFTRFVPPPSAEAAPGAWRAYYERWPTMTGEQLPPDLIELVPRLRRFCPPAGVVDKPSVYSPWLQGNLHPFLSGAGVDTLIISGGETDVCVAATVLGAIDLGYRVILPCDALYGSADETHDAMLGIYRSRFGQQLTVCTTEDVLQQWPRA